MQPMQQMQQMQAPQARDLLKSVYVCPKWIASQGLVGLYDSRCLQDSRTQAFNCRSLGKLEKKRFKIPNMGARNQLNV